MPPTDQQCSGAGPLARLAEPDGRLWRRACGLRPRPSGTIMSACFATACATVPRLSAPSPVQSIWHDAANARARCATNVKWPAQDV